MQGITLPARGVAVHPGEDCDTAVGLAQPHRWPREPEGPRRPCPPRGHGHRVVDRPRGPARAKTAPARGRRPSRCQAIPAAADANKLADIAVENGDVLSLVVGRRGDYSCASTAISLVVAEQSGRRRTWDLAKDVVDDIQAGNPHADSFGNPGVWSFYTILAEGSALHQPPFPMNSKAVSAREFVRELAARNLATIRQRVRRHPEQTWENAVAAMFPGKTLPAIPKPEYEPPMKVDIPCGKLAAQWKLGAWHLAHHAVKNENGELRFDDYPYPVLASETYLVLHALDLVGMNGAAGNGLDQWLALPLDRPKPVGCFSDGAGCFTHAAGPGGSLDGVHGMGPGAIMFTLVEHFRLTGDEEWLRANCAADEGQRRVDPAAAETAVHGDSRRRSPLVQGVAAGAPGHAGQRRTAHAILRVGGLLLAGGARVCRGACAGSTPPKRRAWPPRRKPIAKTSRPPSNVRSP